MSKRDVIDCHSATRFSRHQANLTPYDDVVLPARLDAFPVAWESRFHAAFCNAAVGMALVGIDGRWLEVNDRLCQITGYSREELLQLDVSKLTHPDDWAQDALHLRRILSGETATYKHQKRCVRRDGSLTWVAVTRSLVRCADGRPDYLIATVEDISGAKASELVLQSSNALLDGVIENLPAFVSLKRASDLRILRVNRAAEEMLGCPRDNLVGKNNYDLLPKEDADLLTRVEREVVASGKVGVIDDAPVRLPDGTTRYLRVSKSLLRDADGAPMHVLGVALDITERRQTEERLRLSEERCRMALEVGRLGTFDWDIAKNVVYWDERSSAAIGLEPDETLDYVRSLKLVHPEDRASVTAAVARALDSRSTGPIVHEWRGLRRDGTTRWGEVQARALFAGEGQERRAYRLLGTVRDITARKKAEEHVKLLLHELTHRAKNLLTVVQALARHTANEADPKKFVERFSERLAGLAASHDLLVKSDWRGVDMADLVPSQLEYLGDFLGTRVTFEGPSITLTPSAAQAIGMALHELATNAVKHGALSESHGAVRIAWTSITSCGAPRVRITWSEHGGPLTRQPERRGFGHTIMIDMIEYELGAEVQLKYAPTGIVWELTAPAHRLIEASEGTPERDAAGT